MFLSVKRDLNSKAIWSRKGIRRRMELIHIHIRHVEVLPCHNTIGPKPMFHLVPSQNHFQFRYFLCCLGPKTVPLSSSSILLYLSCVHLYCCHARICLPLEEDFYTLNLKGWQIWLLGTFPSLEITPVFSISRYSRNMCWVKFLKFCKLLKICFQWNNHFLHCRVSFEWKWILSF